MSCRATPYRGFKSHRHRRKVNPRLPWKQAEGGGSSFPQAWLVSTCWSHLFSCAPGGRRSPASCSAAPSLRYTGIAGVHRYGGVPRGLRCTRGCGRRGVARARAPRGNAREARQVLHLRCGTPISLGYTGIAVYLEVCGVPEGGGRGALGAGAGLECGAAPRCDARESPRASGQRARRITNEEAAHCCVGKFWVSLWQPSRRSRQAAGLSNSRVRV